VADTLVSVPLPPLHWIAEEELVYDRERNELHKSSCAGAAGEELARAMI
jgi:hypothetical protein